MQGICCNEDSGQVHLSLNAGLFNNQFNKWKLQGGIRTEQTIATGKMQGQGVLDRNYWQFFPAVFITRTLSKELSGILQYSKRVNRPSFQQQNASGAA